MVGVTLCWLVFSIVVGIIADQRGRSGLGWGFLAAMISPLLAGVILFVLPNIAEELAEEDKKIQQRKREGTEGKGKSREASFCVDDIKCLFCAFH